MRTLSLDLETYSSADLNKTGVYRYVESPDFSILLFGYSVDDGDVAFFHLSDFFSVGVKPQVGQRVSFSIMAGKPKERCSPVLLLKNL